MSRTNKDKPLKFQNKEYDYLFDKKSINNYIWSETNKCFYNCIRYIQVSGVKKKKKRHFFEKQWMTTPMWWIHDYMTVPQRAKNTIWEKRVLNVSMEELDLEDPPINGRKPHFYYW